MRLRTALGGIVLAAGLIVVTPSSASAEESIGKCIIEQVEKLHAGDGEPTAALEKQVETKAEKCFKAPNPILPAKNEMIWGVLSFGILFVVLWKVALPPITKTMAARTERIRSDLASAEAARGEAEGIVQRYNDQLADAHAESQRIIEDARQTAAGLKVELQRQAEADIAEMRRRAQTDLDAAKQQAIGDLRSEVAALAVGAAEKVIERNLDRDTQIQLIENYINQVGSAR